MNPIFYNYCEHRENHYYQFPLCLLQSDDDTLVEHIAYFAVRHLAEKIEEAMTQAEVSGKDEVTRDFHDERDPGIYRLLVDDYGFEDRYGERLVSIKEAHKRLDVYMLSLEDYVRTSSKVRAMYERFTERLGEDAWVRIRADILQDVWDPLQKVTGCLSIRELRVLCAIYSKIGNKDYPEVITVQEIARRAAGFKSQKALQILGTDQELLTRQKIRTTRDKLFKSRFFAMATAGRRTYYSHRISQEDLEEWVINEEVRKREISKSNSHGVVLDQVIKRRLAQTQGDRPSVERHNGEAGAALKKRSSAKK